MIVIDYYVFEKEGEIGCICVYVLFDKDSLIDGVDLFIEIGKGYFVILID